MSVGKKRISTIIHDRVQRKDKRLDSKSDDEITHYVESFLLIKFFKRKYYESFKNGEVRFTKLRLYRSEYENAVMDSKEGVMMHGPTHLSLMCEQDGRQIEIDATNFETTLNYLDNCGIVCFSKPRLNLVYREGRRLRFKFDVQYICNMMKCFDRDVIMCVVKDHMLDKVSEIETVSGYVRYDSHPTYDYYCKHDPAFVKRSDYAYQREFRIVTKCPLDEDNQVVNVGPIDSIMISLRTIEKSYVEVEYDNDKIDIYTTNCDPYE